MPLSAFILVLQALLYPAHLTFQLQLMETPTSQWTQPSSPLSRRDNSRPLLNILISTRPSALPASYPSPKMKKAGIISQVCSRICRSLMGLQHELSTTYPGDVKPSPAPNTTTTQSSVIHILLRAIISFLLLPATALMMSQHKLLNSSCSNGRKS